MMGEQASRDMPLAPLPCRAVHPICTPASPTPQPLSACPNQSSPTTTVSTHPAVSPPAPPHTHLQCPHTPHRHTYLHSPEHTPSLALSSVTASLANMPPHRQFPPPPPHTPALPRAHALPCPQLRNRQLGKHAVHATDGAHVPTERGEAVQSGAGTYRLY